MTPEQRNAFAELVNRHYRRWLRFIRDCDIAEATAEDLLHDVLADLLSLAAFDPCFAEAQVLTFIRQRICWRVQDYFRRTRQREAAGGNHDPPEDREDKKTLPPWAAVLKEEERRKVWEAVCRLPDEQREPLILRFWLDLALPAIAAMLGLSYETVNMRLYRARESLRGCLGIDPFFGPNG